MPSLKMKICIIHDWLVTYAGAERCLEQLLELYPDADLFSLVDFLPKEGRGFIRNKPVKTSFIQNLPFAKKKYRSYLPLMPFAIEQFDLSDYDLVISSSHAVAKGVITGPNQLHVSYVYSPMRYAWDLGHQYVKEKNLDRGFGGLLARICLHYMRIWDVRTANGVDHFLAISEYIAKRIEKAYGRKSTVIFPPVDLDAFTLCEKKESFYVTASRMVPYKRIDLIVEAFSQMPEKKLIVIGDGPERNKIHSKAGDNITFLGHVSTEVMRGYIQRAKAFVFAAEEDFGIAPLEAQASGTPVIAYGKGGALETICGLDSDSPTGIFFMEQSCRALIEAIEEFERRAGSFSPKQCNANAGRFSTERFKTEFLGFIDRSIALHKRKSQVLKQA